MAADRGYEKIQSNYKFLTEELKNGIDNVIRSLHSKGIINDNDKSILLQKGTDGDTRPKVEAFLDKLMYCGEGAYNLFIQTLKDLEFTKAVAKLEQGDQQQPQPSTSNSTGHPSTDLPNRDHQIPRTPDMKNENHMTIENQRGTIYQGCNIPGQGGR